MAIIHSAQVYDVHLFALQIKKMVCSLYHSFVLMFGYVTDTCTLTRQGCTVAIDAGTCANHRFVPRHLCVYRWRENPIYIAVRGDRMVSL